MPLALMNMFIILLVYHMFIMLSYYQYVYHITSTGIFNVTLENLLKVKYIMGVKSHVNRIYLEKYNNIWLALSVKRTLERLTRLFLDIIINKNQELGRLNEIPYVLKFQESETNKKISCTILLKYPMIIRFYFPCNFLRRISANFIHSASQYY